MCLGFFVRLLSIIHTCNVTMKIRRYLICIYSGASLLALYTFVHDPMNGAAPTVHGGSSAVA